MRRLTGAGRRKLLLFGFGLALAGCVATPPPEAETAPQTAPQTAMEARATAEAPAAPEAAKPSPGPVAVAAAEPAPRPAAETGAAPEAATPSPVPAAVAAAEPAPPPAAEARAAPEAETPSPIPAAVVAAEPAPRPAVRAARHMVAAENPLAAKAGLEILRAGGSAIDAAIAVQMVLNVVEPQSGQICSDRAPGSDGSLLGLQSSSALVQGVLAVPGQLG